MSGQLLLRRPLHLRCLSSRLSQVRRYALIGKPQARGEPPWALPKTPARTRFAPSPTGYLHLGSLRTALFNYLLAKATGGQFILRLEDTDRTRFVEDAEQRLYEDMRWAGLEWDEGPDLGEPLGPYKQSERLALYRQHAESLLESGHAFRCFCSKEDLDFNISQATASGGAAHYPGTCLAIEKSEADRRAANGEPHVIRFKASNVPVVAPDLVYGAYKKGETEDDFIIMKSDGFPTYHFANVVDDHFMNITHVIRGAEWLISTPKHIELYNAFGWQPPSFAHVGLLVDQQRQKLSKRDMANIGVSVYRENRIIPLALLNFAVQLGWDPNLQKKPELKKKHGVLTLDEMRENFTLKFTRGDIIVDMAKLKFFQSHVWRGVISGQMDEPPTFQRQFVDPIIAELTKIVKDIDAHGEGQGSANPALLKSISLSASTYRPHEHLTPEFVIQVLKAWKGSVGDYATFVPDCLYAFCRPSASAYQQGFHEIEPPIAKLRLYKDGNQPIDTDVSRLFKWLRSRFGSVSAENWNVNYLDKFVKDTVNAIAYYDRDEKVDKKGSAGWKILRWTLFNNRPGLTIVPAMVLLGQQEIQRRLKKASRVAASEEDALLRERPQEDKLNLVRKVRIGTLGNPPAQGESDGEFKTMDVSERAESSPLAPPSIPREPNYGPFRIGEPLPDHREHIEHVRGLHLAIKEGRLANTKGMSRNEKLDEMKATRLGAFAAPNTTPLGTTPRNMASGPNYRAEALNRMMTDLQPERERKRTIGELEEEGQHKASEDQPETLEASEKSLLGDWSKQR